MNVHPPFPTHLKMCPRTGAEVAGSLITYQATVEGLVEWWRCSACDHWHVSEQEGQKLKIEKENFVSEG